MSTDALWSTDRARALIARHDPGGLIRLGREDRGWRQAELGARLGCSASAVSRLERHGHHADLTLLRHAADRVGMPMHVLAASLGLGPCPATTVAAQERCAEEDTMRRRTLLAAATLATPLTLLTGVDTALAGVPAPTGSTTPAVATRLAAARRLFDTGQHARLLAELPGLLGDAHDAARSRDEIALARLSSCYRLVAEVLVKIGEYERARRAADRATITADISGSPLAAVAAAREMSIVLRHQDQPDAAQDLILNAANRTEATGLKTDAQTSAYAQILCTTAYTAARSGDRGQALSLLGEAARAACRLPDRAPAEGRLFPFTPAQAKLYQVSVRWALGDAGAALDAGRMLYEDQFATHERKGRMHTDLARAWWQWGKAEQTAAELLLALRVSPGEVRDRPSIRKIVTDLRSRHPRVPGVRELVAATGPSAN
ncbi:multiprotein-bridging factor 1 family protein [Streptomyces sp. NPDC057654]|uniref:helix-turn-helix domain-containing protein n=1 Tax=Streptomyces sp. NPDC057654 TaxID=3346196 RepID=UPI0036A5DF25